MATASVVRTAVLEGVSSASGVEVTPAGRVFAVGDDAIYLYELEADGAGGWRVAGRFELMAAPEGQPKEGIAKKVKPDFECLTPLPPRGGAAVRVAALGSGSKSPSRDGMVVVDLAASTPAAPVVEALSLTRLYDELRRSGAVLGSAKLNLEGASLVAGDTTLVLAQRGNVSAVNTLMAMPVGEFEACARDAALPLPPIAITRLHLPLLDRWNAGLSGVTTLTLGSVEYLLFAASYEGTDNEIDDGPTLGSIVGLMRADALATAPAGRVGTGGVAAADAEVTPATALIKNADGTTFIGKVEGVAALSATLSDDGATAHIRALAVTDPDGDPSQYVVLDLVLPTGGVAAAGGAAGGAGSS